MRGLVRYPRVARKSAVQPLKSAGAQQESASRRAPAALYWNGVPPLAKATPDEAPGNAWVSPSQRRERRPRRSAERRMTPARPH